MAKNQDEERQNLNVPGPAAFKTAMRARAEAVVTRVERCCVREYWAVVERDGSLVRGRNVVRTARLADGQYEVVFTDNVSNGVYVATIGRPGIATEPAGEIGVALRCCLSGGEADHGVWVDTHDSTGEYSDRAFHLIVLND